MKNKKVEETIHTPVLLKEVIENLNLNQGDIVVDGTLGGGGYFREICKGVGKGGVVIGIDQDQKAIDKVSGVLGNTIMDTEYPHTYLVSENFRNLDKVLDGLDIKKINALTLDIGLSSDQLEESGRGFSFQKDEPLLMNMGNTELTAKEIVNNWDEENIADIIFGYGEERYARRIAKQIIEARREKPIQTTFDLVEIIREAVPFIYTKKKTHFATKTFQALRITVNDELGALREGLQKGFDALDTTGRMVIVSFHSLEDRIVKRFMRDKKDSGEGILITKKPIISSDEEVKNNPRARSAKLRVIERI